MFKLIVLIMVVAIHFCCISIPIPFLILTTKVKISQKITKEKKRKIYRKMISLSNRFLSKLSIYKLIIWEFSKGISHPDITNS